MEEPAFLAVDKYPFLYHFTQKAIKPGDHIPARHSQETTSWNLLIS